MSTGFGGGEAPLAVLNGRVGGPLKGCDIKTRDWK